MILDFNLDNIETTEFGLGRDTAVSSTFDSVPANGDVQSVLRDMLVATIANMDRISSSAPKVYEPSEKYSTNEYLTLPIDHEFAVRFRQLQEADTLDTSWDALIDLDHVYCYFARFIDITGRRIVALRRAAQFKSLGKRHIVTRVLDNALTLAKDPLFTLDADFDLFVEGDVVHILRPASFEFAGKLQQAICEAVPRNIQSIQSDLPNVELERIEAYARQHPRAARYLASIRSQNWTRGVDQTLLKGLCQTQGIQLTEVNGRLSVSDDDIMDFIELLDRRRYGIDLVPASPERFRAASRDRLN